MNTLSVNVHLTYIIHTDKKGNQGSETNKYSASEGFINVACLVTHA